MTKKNSSDPLKDEQTARFRAILKGDEEEQPAPAQESPRSFLDRLPRAPKTASAPPEPTPAASKRVVDNPEASAANPPPEAVDSRNVRMKRYRYAFWNVTSWMALLVDSILIALVIILLLYVHRLNVQMKELQSWANLPLPLVKGMYSNFETMTGAHIITTVPLNTEIPVQFDLQINQQTDVVLSQAITINGAHVTLATGGLEMSSIASIVLPAGTRLPITLSLTVPVDKRVPVTLQVPVDINLATSDLGPAFTGLMDVLEPLYCLLDSKAVDSAGVLICEKAKIP
jgi:hypothetical protein